MIMTSCGVRKTSPARSVGSWLLMPQLNSDFSFVYGYNLPSLQITARDAQLTNNATRFTLSSSLVTIHDS